MNRLNRVLAGAAATVILASCTSTSTTPEVSPPSGPVQPSSTPSATPGDGLDDLAAIDAAVRQSHADAFAVVPEAVWAKRVEELRASFPSLTPEQRIVAMAGLAGLLDTHTQFFFPQEQFFDAWLYRFPEGLYVVAAEDASLVGTRLLSVDGTPVKKIEKKIRDLIPADNDSAILNMAWLLGQTDYLSGLGVTDSKDKADFEVVGRDGQRRTVTVASVDIEPFAVAQGLLGSLGGIATEAIRRRGEPVWSRIDKKNKAFLLTLNDYTFEGRDEALTSMTKALDSGTVDHVVIDMRYLRGGDPSPLLPIVEAVSERKLRDPAAVTVLIGRENESAGTVLAEQFDVATEATLVGEPTPARADNFLCPCTEVPLPSSGYVFSVPTTRAGNGDKRDAVVPDLVMRMKAADYFAGKDLVLQAALRGTLPD